MTLTLNDRSVCAAPLSGTIDARVTNSVSPSNDRPDSGSDTLGKREDRDVRGDPGNRASNSAPIGIFDSGLGGLSVMLAVRKALPHENLLYFADCGYAPYGDRSPEYILERSEIIAQTLIDKGAKALVVACNTATATAVQELRAKFSIPIIGIEPAVKPAALATRTGVIGVLATTRTLTSERYRDLVKRFARDRIRVVSVPCPGLMECVERGDWDSPSTESLIARYLEPIRKANADQVVLGCTHYPFLTKQIAAQLSEGVRIIDPSAAVARELKHRLEMQGALNTEGVGSELFWVSSETEKHRKIIATLWGSDPDLRRV